MASKDERRARAEHLPRLYSFTELRRMRIGSENTGELLGHVWDVIVVQQGDEAIAKLLTVRNPQEDSSVLIPWDRVSRIEGRSILLRGTTSATSEPGAGPPFSVRRDLLGRRVVDHESLPAGRVHDVLLLLDERGLAINGLVLSRSMALARLAQLRLAPRRTDVVSWTKIDPHFLESRHLRVTLRVSREQL
jgi:sporulation protein YlmC with PRC-barrel domain